MTEQAAKDISTEYSDLKLLQYTASTIAPMPIKAIFNISIIHPVKSKTTSLWFQITHIYMAPPRTKQESSPQNWLKMPVLLFHCASAPGLVWTPIFPPLLF